MFNKKVFLRSISLGMATVVLVGIGMLSGCTTTVSNDAANKAEDKNPTAIEENKQDKIMPEFLALLGENPQPDTIIEFMDKNIAGATKKDAAIMLDELEKAQKNYLPALEGKYYGESIQESLSKIYVTDFNLDKIYDTEDVELKSLLAETRAMGYKVETAEGMFFPIMNYELMKKFSPYATEDMKDYIAVMSVETNKVPAKDAALIISWEEVIERALAQESFIKKHGSSVKIEAVKELLKKYTTFLMLGLNNTPLFSYETKVMDPEAKEAYIKAVKDNSDSELMQLLGRYMEVLEKSDYRLSGDVEKFRKDELGSN